MPGEYVGQARLDPDADQRELADCSHSAAMANCSSPSLTPVLAYGSAGCGWDRDMAMSR